MAYLRIALSLCSTRFDPVRCSSRNLPSRFVQRLYCPTHRDQLTWAVLTDSHDERAGRALHLAVQDTSRPNASVSRPAESSHLFLDYLSSFCRYTSIPPLQVCSDGRTSLGGTPRFRREERGSFECRTVVSWNERLSAA